MVCKSKPPVCAGDLRTTVGIYSNVGTPDAFGQYGAENQTTLLFEARAMVEDMSGNEGLRFERAAAKAGAKITMRYNAQLAFSGGTKLLMLIDGEWYNIRHIKNWQHRNKWLIIRAEAGVAQ